VIMAKYEHANQAAAKAELMDTLMNRIYAATEQLLSTSNEQQQQQHCKLDETLLLASANQGLTVFHRCCEGQKADFPAAMLQDMPHTVDKPQFVQQCLWMSVVDMNMTIARRVKALSSVQSMEDDSQGVVRASYMADLTQHFAADLEQLRQQEQLTERQTALLADNLAVGAGFNNA